MNFVPSPRPQSSLHSINSLLLPINGETRPMTASSNYISLEDMGFSKENRPMFPAASRTQNSTPEKETTTLHSIGKRKSEADSIENDFVKLKPFAKRKKQALPSWFHCVTDEQIKNSVLKHTTYYDVLIELGFEPEPQTKNPHLFRFKGTIYKRMLHNRCAAMKVDASHLRDRCKNGSDTRTAEPKAKTSKIHTRDLRKTCEEDGRPYVCEWCHCKHYTWDNFLKTWTWQGRPFTLEIHHKQGREVVDAHKASNLQILCPQCHATTENYNGRKKK